MTPIVYHFFRYRPNLAPDIDYQPQLRYYVPCYAGVAQLIERFLAKEEATSLSLVTRTKYLNYDPKGSFSLSQRLF